MNGAGTCTKLSGMPGSLRKQSPSHFYSPSGSIFPDGCSHAVRVRPGYNQSPAAPGAARLKSKKRLVTTVSVQQCPMNCTKGANYLTIIDRPKNNVSFLPFSASFCPQVRCGPACAVGHQKQSPACGAGGLWVQPRLRVRLLSQLRYPNNGQRTTDNYLIQRVLDEFAVAVHLVELDGQEVGPVIPGSFLGDDHLVGGFGGRGFVRVELVPHVYP